MTPTWYLVERHKLRLVFEFIQVINLVTTTFTRKITEEALKPLLWALELHMTTIAEIDGNLEYLDKLRMIKECMIKDEKENG